MIKAIFFDLDGTLCDPGNAWEMGVGAAVSHLASRHPAKEAAFQDAWQVTNESLRGKLAAGQCLMRDVIDQRFPSTLSRLGIVDTELAGAMNDILSQTRLDALTLMPDANRVLGSLRADYHLGIITNGSDTDYIDSQPSTLRHLGLLDQVDSVWISDSVGSRKPESRIFSAALAGAGVSADEAVFVGDSLRHDIAGANAAGITSVLLDPNTHFDRSSAIVPDHIIRSLSDLAPLLSDQE